MSRVVTRTYKDPLDTVWIEVARRVGYEVRRSDTCFASIAPDGRMILGAAETLDADDCLAQMIFHELCHSLVQGPAGHGVLDWGLDNETARDVPREHATLRVQATLAAELGLRAVLAPTTDFRVFYDALPDDALAGDPIEVELAHAALKRADEAPWGPHLRAGLAATRQIVNAVAPFTDATALLSRE